MVGDRMQTDIVTAGPQEDMLTVTLRILESGRSSLPVIDSGRKLLGVIGGLEVLRGALPSYLDMVPDVAFLPPDFDLDLDDTRSLRDVRVEEIMRREPLYTVEEDSSVAEAAVLMLHHRVRALPVVRDGLLVGVINRTDILRGLAEASLRPSREDGRPEA